VGSGEWREIRERERRSRGEKGRYECTRRSVKSAIRGAREVYFVNGIEF
jgi:hypothetical protein